MSLVKDNKSSRRAVLSKSERSAAQSHWSLALGICAPDQQYLGAQGVLGYKGPGPPNVISRLISHFTMVISTITSSYPTL